MGCLMLGACNSEVVVRFCISYSFPNFVLLKHISVNQLTHLNVVLLAILNPVVTSISEIIFSAHFKDNYIYSCVFSFNM